MDSPDRHNGQRGRDVSFYVCPFVRSSLRLSLTLIVRPLRGRKTENEGASTMAVHELDITRQNLSRRDGSAGIASPDNARPYSKGGHRETGQLGTRSNSGVGALADF